MVVTILVLIVLNLIQCNKRENIKDAELDAVSLSRIEAAYDLVEEREKRIKELEDSLEQSSIKLSVARDSLKQIPIKYVPKYRNLPTLTLDEQREFFAGEVKRLDAIRRGKLEAAGS